MISATPLPLFVLTACDGVARSKARILPIRGAQVGECARLKTPTTGGEPTPGIARPVPFSNEATLHDLTPLLTDTVAHWLPPQRDVFGKETPAGSTSHPARVIVSPGKFVAEASAENMPDAAATIWLLNHPRQILIGDTFGLPDGQALKAIRTETRTRPWGGTLHKVYLS